MLLIEKIRRSGGRNVNAQKSTTALFYNIASYIIADFMSAQRSTQYRMHPSSDSTRAVVCLCYLFCNRPLFSTPFHRLWGRLIILQAYSSRISDIEFARHSMAKYSIKHVACSAIGVWRAHTHTHKHTHTHTTYEDTHIQHAAAPLLRVLSTSKNGQCVILINAVLCCAVNSACLHYFFSFFHF